MHLSFDRPLWALLLIIGIAITIAACGGNSTGPDLSKLEILSVVPDSGMVGDSVTIEGTGGFAPELSENILTFNGTPATVLSTTPDQLITKVPDGASSGRLTLEVKNQTIKGPYFNVLSFDPVITDVSPARAIPGTEIEITGKHFLSSHSSQNKDTDNPQPKGILAKSKAGITSSIGVLSDKRPGIGRQSPKADTPHTSNITGASAQNKVKSATTNADAISISFGGQQAPVHSASDTLLITEVPEGASGNIIEVTIGEQSMEWDTFQLLAPLNVRSLSPESGPIGTSVSIQGEGFHAQADSNTVTFNGTESTVEAASSKELSVIVPPNAKDGPVAVTAYGQTTQGPAFTVTEPVVELAVSGINPTKGPAGTNVTITGQGFNTTPSENIVNFDGSQATITAATTTELTATVPDGATTGPVSVTIGPKTATGPIFEVSTNSSPAFTSPAALNIKENTSVVDTLIASDPDGDTLTFINSGGADSNQFSIDEQTRIISFTAPPDFEAPVDANSDNIYQLQVEVSDRTLSVTQELSITVQNINDVPPTITSSNAITIKENNSAVDTLTATDPEGGPVTFSISGGDDQDLFTLDGQTGALAFTNAPDYDNPSDANTDNVYELQISASDGALSASQDITITVTDINENQAPSITSSSSLNIKENSTLVDTLSATDPNGDAITFSLSGGTDQQQFTLAKQSGVLRFSQVPDFESPADADGDNNYEVQVSVTDGSTSVSQNLTIIVTDVTENQAPSITSDASISLAENTTVVDTVTATDPNGDPIMFSQIGGTDQDQFAINQQSGVLTFNNAPDYEAPTDANSDNIYQLQVEVSDGTLSVTQELSITVQNKNDVPPTITSGNAFTIKENISVVDTVVASDPEGDAISYSISGGDDQDLFTLDGQTGAVAFTNAPDYENPTDANTDNTYELQVSASDGALSASQDITVTVTDVNENEAPSITSSSSLNIKENSTLVDTLSATDPNGDAIIFSLSGGTDQQQFTLDKQSGVLRFSQAPDYESPSDANGDNNYEVQVSVTDGSTSASQNLTITVTDVTENQAPSITSDASISLEENTTAVDTVTATDPNGDPITFRLIGGTDQDQFSIDQQSGGLAFTTAPDYENPSDANADNVYEVQVSASDGSLSASQAITVTITDVNENQPPSFISSASLTINENNTVVDTLTASDPEGDSITLGLSGGTDQNLFSLDEQSGELSFSTAPDHEAPTDADNDNIYELQVEAADNSGSTTQDMTVTVQNLNDNTPTITQSTYEVEENKTEIGTIAASDPDGDALTYELNGGVDENFFTLDSQTGSLSFNSPRDYEQPTDGGQIGSPTDNEYEVRIVVKDGENIAFESLSVIVTNVAEPVKIVRGSIQNEYRTEQSNGQFVFDPVLDGFDTGGSAITIVLDDTKGTPQSATIGGPDGGLFTVESIVTSNISGNSIKISGPVLNYDHSADGTPHQYKFTLTTTSTDNTTSDSQSFVIPVTLFEGLGTASDPYVVDNLEKLQNVKKFLDAHFIQTQNIDASPTASWNDGKGFIPIGTKANSFSGTYNGSGFEISNLTINQPNEKYRGLFSNTAAGSTLKNIIITGADFKIEGGGVLAGYNRGIIDNCRATGTIEYPGETSLFTVISIGGLVGSNGKDGFVPAEPSGKIINSHSGVDINNANMAGGIAAKNFAPIINSSASGSVLGFTYAGGLAGSNSSEIINSSTDGLTRSAGYVGGVVGINFKEGYLEASSATGKVADYKNGTASSAGGLVGDLAGTVIESWSSATIELKSGTLGGLIGSTSSDDTATVKRSFSTGLVTAEGCSWIGGFVGTVSSTTTIYDSYSTGEVNYPGFNTTSYCNEPDVASFVAINDGQIVNSYAVGLVIGMDGHDLTSGFVKTNNGTVTDSYWDKWTTNESSSDSGTGLTTSQMTGSAAETNMTGFDFNNIWQTNTGGYPTLRSNPPSNN